MMAAILTCGASVFTACSNDDNPVDGETGASSIAMIVKNGKIDYWRQIETAFRGICQEKDLEARYYATSAENGYQEQLAAVAELRKLDNKKLKGIIFTPSYGLNGESAEAEVAALAKELDIPVVILDSPVSASSPLASYPYFGTDNTAAGQAMADKVMADKVAVFAMTNSPGMERAEAFKALKPNAVIYPVADKCNDEVQAVLDEYNDFVFFNGNDLVDAVPILKAARKRVYTFDAYGEFLDELIAGSAFLKGIMAQNTFGMTRKAVDAIIDNAKQGEMVPTFYITEDNLGDDNVKPFLEFYNKQAPAAIDGLAEKLLGKWIEVEIDGQPAPTCNNSATTFVSATKAYYSSSRPDYTETQLKWSAHREYDVNISGNKVTLTGHPETEPYITLFDEYVITSITATEMVCKYRHTTIRDGQIQGLITEKNARLVKTDIDYRQDVVGTWEGQTSDGLNVRWDIRADGTYLFSQKVGSGDWEIMDDDLFNEYFADGYLFCVRWQSAGEKENREWWQIESIQNGVMKWKALKQNPDGSTSTTTAELTKVPDLNIAERIIGKWIKTDKNGQPLTTDGKMVYDFVSATKAYMSASIDASPEVGTHWVDKLEVDIVISGNKLSIINYEDETKMVVEFDVTAINANEFTANHKVTITVDGKEVYSVKDVLRFTKVTTDYAAAILGTWECQEITGGETYNDANGRLEFKADGTYIYYRRDNAGKWQAVTTREFQDYFVDGYLVNTRWKNVDEKENREWWEIASISGDQMLWTALRQKTDGTMFEQGMRWKKVE